MVVVAVLVIASACSPSHSGTSAKIHVKTASQQGQDVIDAQRRVPALQTAGQFCLTGIKQDSKDTTISQALDQVDPAGAVGKAWNFSNLAGDQVTVTKKLASGQIFVGTFDLGQIIYAILSETGEQATQGTPDEVEWKLFGLIGPAAIYCAEAALWLDGTVGGQIGTALQKKFLAWPVGQQLLDTRGSAIAGKWVLYRKLENCSVTSSSNNGCILDPMDVTIACTRAGCTIIRTNAGAGFEPWDHSISIAFGQGGWQAAGTEKWAANCDHAPVAGSGVAVALKVTSAKVVNGVWRALSLAGTFVVNNAATSCFPSGTSKEDVSTTSFTPPCTLAALSSALRAADVPLVLPENWVVQDHACQSGYALADLGGIGYPVAAVFRQEGMSWTFAYVLGEFNSCSTEQNGSIVHGCTGGPSQALLQSLTHQAASTPSGYSKHTNPRYGFMAFWPSSFKAQPPSANGDGQTWTSSDGQVLLSASGVDNSTGYSPGQDEASDARSMSVIYDNISGNVVTVSGYTNGARTIVYQQDVVGPGVIDTLRWSYPASQKAQWDAAVTLTAQTFQPGNVAAAP
jgi:hypothetical protein